LRRLRRSIAYVRRNAAVAVVFLLVLRDFVTYRQVLGKAEHKLFFDAPKFWCGCVPLSRGECAQLSALKINNS
jgi:hypothetical protein